MQLLIDQDLRRSVRSLYDDRLSVLPEIEASDSLPFTIAALTRIQHSFDSRLFTPDPLTGTTFRVAIGGGFALPVAGSFTLTYEALDTTEETTADIGFNPTAGEIEDALNAGAKMILTGGVTVTGGAGFFTIAFNVEGAQNLLFGDVTDLVPLSILDIRRAVAGTVNAKEIQSLRIAQNAGAATILDTANAAADVTLDIIEAGGTGQNCQLRVTITGDPYRGSWTFTADSEASQAIQWDDSPSQVQTKLEAISGVGTGNMAVTQESETEFFIEFIGTLAATLIVDPAVDGSNLVALPTISGVLDLTVPGVDYLLNGSDSAVVRLEVEKGGSMDLPVKIFSQSILLRRPVIELPTAIPTSDVLGLYYTKAQIDAMTGDSAAVTVSTAGTNDLAPAAPFVSWFQKIIAQAGVGAYTRKFTLDNAQAKDGAIFRVYIELAQSGNPTVEIYDDSVAGTLLQTLTGDTDNAGFFLFQAEFDRGAVVWSKISGAYLV